MTIIPAMATLAVIVILPFKVPGQTVSISSNAFTRAVQVATTVRQLTGNRVTAQRDRVWLSFMVQFYKQNPNVEATSVASAYQAFTNAFAQLASAVNFSSTWSNPSEPEILNLAVAAAAQIPSFGQFAASAAEAVESATLAAQKASSLLESINNAELLANGLPLANFDLQKSVSRVTSGILPGQWQKLVADALALADNNPTFLQAYQSIIAPLTQISPGDSIAQILATLPNLQADPTLNALLSQLDGAGQLLTTVSNITGLFAGQISTVVGEINNGISAVGNTFQQADTGLPDFLQGVLAPDFSPPFGNDIPIPGEDIQATAAAANLLSTLVGDVDPSLGQQISIVGNAVSTVATVVSDIGSVVAIGAELYSGDIAGAVMGIFGLFGGGGSADQTQQQLQQISSSINSLHQDMDQQFSQVDSALNTIYTNMEAGFTDIDRGINNLANQMQVVNAQLFSLQGNLNLLEQNLYNYVTADSQDDLLATLSECLGYQANHGGAPMPLGQSGVGLYGGDGFRGFENSLYNWAVIRSIDAIWAPTDNAVITQYGNYSDISARLNLLENFLMGLGVTNLAAGGQAIPNPRIWAISANGYAELARENPQYFQNNTYTPAYHLSQIIDTGNIIQSYVSQLTYADGGVNWQLWKRCLFVLRAPASTVRQWHKRGSVCRYPEYQRYRGFGNQSGGVSNPSISRN